VRADQEAQARQKAEERAAQEAVRADQEAQARQKAEERANQAEKML
jgi:hypothetical protein